MYGGRPSPSATWINVQLQITTNYSNKLSNLLVLMHTPLSKLRNEVALSDRILALVLDLFPSIFGRYCLCLHLDNSCRDRLIACF